MAENAIFRSHFLKNYFEFRKKSKNAWRYSCDEHVEAAVITVGACNKPHEALPGPHIGHLTQKKYKSMAENAIFRSHFLEKYFEFRKKSKNAWRYSCDEHVGAGIITVGACNKPQEALPGPHIGHSPKKNTSPVNE